MTSKRTNESKDETGSLNEALLEAAKKGELEKVQQLLKDGASINYVRIELIKNEMITFSLNSRNIFAREIMPL